MNCTGLNWLRVCHEFLHLLIEKRGKTNYLIPSQFPRFYFLKSLSRDIFFRNCLEKSSDNSLFLSTRLNNYVLFPQTICRAYEKKTLRKNSLYEGLLPLFSPVLLFILLNTWVSLSPCKILVKQTRVFLWMTGVSFSNVMVSIPVCLELSITL